MRISDWSSDVCSSDLRILVSHSRIWEEERADHDKSERATRKKDTLKQAKSVKKVKESVERTTLGDLAVLANLKAEMEDSEKQTRKSEKPAEPKEEAPAKEEATAEAPSEKAHDDETEEGHQTEPNAQDTYKAEATAEEKPNEKKK